MKLLIPHKRDRFRLVADLSLGHQLLPAGTVFRVENTRINAATKDNERVYCRVMASPDPELAMKRHGGRHSFGYSFTIGNDVLRTVEVEIVEGMD